MYYWIYKEKFNRRSCNFRDLCRTKPPADGCLEVVGAIRLTDQNPTLWNQLQRRVDHNLILDLDYLFLGLP